jgi:hypothetical protein
MWHWWGDCRQCGVVVLDEEGNVVQNAIPTIEQLKEKFSSLLEK